MLGQGLNSLIPPKDDNSQTQNNLPASLEPAQILDPKTIKEEDDLLVVRQPIPAEPDPIAGSLPEPELIRESSGIKKPQIHLHKRAIDEAIFQIEIDKIKPNPLQPRKDFGEEGLKELATSIREYGILQPLIVSKIEKETEFGTDVQYQLIAGERRLKAAKLLGWERVPAIIKSIDQKSQGLEMAIIENLQRENLNPIETARAYAKLQDEFGLTQREIAAKLGKSRETIANTLRLLNLPSDIQEALIKNSINESQARLLLAIPDQNEQQVILKDLLVNHLSVRELRSRIRKAIPSGDDSRNKARTIDPEIKFLEDQLTERLGAKVNIEKSKTGGKIIINFYSPEEIHGIIDKIKPADRDSAL